ncbi:transporter (CPA2 family) [Streptomyces sp. 1114.5]|uniref:cation:proton antiporter n=1 Tax=Streptomyces sp. 1114.5 TaxID=1938830 RepID=UPI000F13B93D|nr:cation:proton antiporter [Streptomyces sp. 1114.5]RKT19380.1 transporter (CPA2 family) [Streptomyces sp. 1114.5]
MPLAVGPVAPLAAHDLMVFLLQVGLLLGLAVLLGRLFTRLGLSAVVGELFVGVLLGPSLLGHLAPGFSEWLLPHDPARFHLLDAFGQIGVILMVGVTGLQMDLGLVRKRGATAVRVSVPGIVVPLALGIGLAFMLPDSLLGRVSDRSTFALFVGVAMGVSAIPVIAKTLIELGLLHRNIGQLTLCAVTVDDIVGWLLLSVVSAMATVGVSGGQILHSIANLVVVVVLALVLRRIAKAAGPRLANGAAGPSVLALLVAALLLAAAGTQALGLEAVFGAFLCGLALTGTPLADPNRLAPVRTVVVSILAPVFFATAGLRMDLTALTRPTVLLAGLAVLAIAIIGKFSGAYLGARISRMSHWEGLALGAGMNARGVIEVVVAMVGLKLGVLSQEMYTVVILVAIVTSLMAPPLLRRFMARIEETAEERLREDALSPKELAAHL